MVGSDLTSPASFYSITLHWFLKPFSIIHSWNQSSPTGLDWPDPGENIQVAQAMHLLDISWNSCHLVDISCVKVTVSAPVILLMLSAALLLTSLCLGIFIAHLTSPLLQPWEVGLSDCHSHPADVDSDAERLSDLHRTSN